MRPIVTHFRVAPDLRRARPLIWHNNSMKLTRMIIHNTMVCKYGILIPLNFDLCSMFSFSYRQPEAISNRSVGCPAIFCRDNIRIHTQTDVTTETPAAASASVLPILNNILLYNYF